MRLDLADARAPSARGRRLRVLLPVTLLLAAAGGPAVAQDGGRFDAMNQPAPPVHILGNLYYVGANDLSSYLITTPAGHILIDGGVPETVPIIRANVVALGFRLEDVKILLHSHAHADHVGGLAQLKQLTGAQLMASERDTPLLERGGHDDPLLGDSLLFPPVKVDRQLHDGEKVELGGTVLTARLTPGHTQGCTTWVAWIEDGGTKHLMVSICSLTVLPGTRFFGTPTYPGIADDYAHSLDILESLPAEVFLASHASFFDMDRKRAALAAGAPGNPFFDPEGYRRFLAQRRQIFERALEDDRVRAGAPGGG